MHYFQVGHIKRLQHGIKDIQQGKLPPRLLQGSCSANQHPQAAAAAAAAAVPAAVPAATPVDFASRMAEAAAAAAVAAAADGDPGIVVTHHSDIPVTLTESVGGGGGSSDAFLSLGNKKERSKSGNPVPVADPPSTSSTIHVNW